MKDQKKIDDQKVELGKLLKKAREKNGVSTYRLEKSGITFATKEGIEKGNKAYTIDTLIHYCQESKIELKLSTD